MKKLISALALMTFALVLFAAAPVSNTIDGKVDTKTELVKAGDLGHFDKDPTLDGDKKKKKSSSKSCCSSKGNTTSAKSNCSGSQGAQGTATKSCCSSKGTTAKKTCEPKSE